MATIVLVHLAQTKLEFRKNNPNPPCLQCIFEEVHYSQYS